MTLPLAVLAVLSLAGGYFNVPHWLEPCSRHAEEGHDSLAGGDLGGRRARRHRARVALLRRAGRGMADSLAGALGGLYTLVYNKYFVDEIYDAAIVQPIVEAHATVLWKGVDVGVIDGSGERRRRARAQHRRRAAPDAIGQHPQLRHLGAARLACCVMVAIGVRSEVLR